MSDKYCLCYPQKTGVILMGWGQFLATLYFLALFLTWEPYYYPAYFIGFMAYYWRAYHFFKMVYLDESDESKFAYYREFKYTTPGIIVCFLWEAGLRYAEWGVFPTWDVIFYGILLGLSYHSAQVVKSWGQVTDDNSFWIPYTSQAHGPGVSTDKIISKKAEKSFDFEEGTQISVVML